MPDSLAVIGILGALLLGAISPGPSFVVVSRISVTHTRRHGLAAAAGMGCGAVIFATLALAGVNGVLSHVPWLYAALKAAGGLYLLIFAVRLWRSSSAPLAGALTGGVASSSLSPGRAFAWALLTQLSNPKTALIFSSIFAAFLPQSPNMATMLILPPLIFISETCWYSVVAVVFSAAGPQRAFLGAKTTIDRLAGCVVGALGARLLADAGHTALGGK